VIRTAQILAKRIKELRGMRGLTQKELAKILEISQVHLGFAEIGKRLLSDKVRERLVDFFGIPLPSLYDDGNYFNAETAIKCDRNLTEKQKKHLLDELKKIKEAGEDFPPPFPPPSF